MRFGQTNPNEVKFDLAGSNEMMVGTTVACTAVVEIDVNSLARDFLANRVLPVVEGYGLSEEFAAFAWMKLTASEIQVELPMTDNHTSWDILEVTSGDSKVSAVHMGRSLRIALDGFSSDSRVSCPSIRVSVTFSAKVPLVGDQEPIHFVIEPEVVTFDFSLTVGIGEEDGPLVGGIKGRMVGTGAQPLMDVVLGG